MVLSNIRLARALVPQRLSRSRPNRQLQLLLPPRRINHIRLAPNREMIVESGLIP
jgi:hypothetical protein